MEFCRTRYYRLRFSTAVGTLNWHTFCVTVYFIAFILINRDDRFYRSLVTVFFVLCIVLGFYWLEFWWYLLKLEIKRTFFGYFAGLEIFSFCADWITFFFYWNITHQFDIHLPLLPFLLFYFLPKFKHFFVQRWTKQYIWYCAKEAARFSIRDMLLSLWLRAVWLHYCIQWIVWVLCWF
jgi:hypothetical protein